jgi:hypothetical protein
VPWSLGGLQAGRGTGKHAERKASMGRAGNKRGVRYRTWGIGGYRLWQVSRISIRVLVSGMCLQPLHH